MIGLVVGATTVDTGPGQADSAGNVAVVGTAITREKTLMPYLVPSRTPLTPEQVERAFDYVLALRMGGGAATAGRAEADPT